MKKILITVVLLIMPLIANATTVEPGNVIEAWRIDTPIIPESNSSRYIENLGSVPIKAILQWKVTWGQWKEVKSKIFQPGEHGNLTSSQAFYHQRLLIENLSKDEPAEVNWG